VLRTSLHLGLTSFGGPLAHLGYFERTYVQRLGWLSGEDYSALVALCQVLPGPSSSQVGFLIGLYRAGWSGALAAWLGFTLPSGLLLYGCAVLSAHVHWPITLAVVHGLKLAAVAVVAQARVASRVLQLLVQLSDESGVPLQVIPRRVGHDGGPEDDALEAWYRRNGFVHAPTPDTPRLMRRAPRPLTAPTSSA
jgi:hypothetical protein